jgi:hypothetical protein
MTRPKKGIDVFKFVILILTAVLATSAMAAPPESPGAAPNKFVTLDTKSYTLESPDGWVVSEETPFRQREIHPKEDARGQKSGLCRL